MFTLAILPVGGFVYRLAVSFYGSFYSGFFLFFFFYGLEDSALLAVILGYLCAESSNSCTFYSSGCLICPPCLARNFGRIRETVFGERKNLI